MRKTNQLTAGLLALLMGFSLVACEGGKSSFYAEQPDEFIESETGTVICYDNLGLGYVDAKDTVYTLDLTDKAAGMTVVPVATDGQGNVVDMNKVASFDAATGKLTAIGKGTVLLNVVDSKGDVKSTAKVQVSPAYPEDPGNQYELKRGEYTRGQSKLMGGLHDPSLIEVPGENGQSTYYIFSTGWENGNDIHKSTDLITWSYAQKPIIAESELTEIYAWLGTKSTGASPSWWAPDIYPAPDGGYWLYTCIVDGAKNGVPQTIEGETENYSMACIVLFHSDRIDGKYTYEGVLMQSCIPSSGAVYDVNAIDPQIITTPDGRLFMAYGSFGTGNYILELNTKTGLRLDNYNKGKWLTPTEVREQRDNIVKEFNVYKNEAGDMMGWNSPYYGIAISRKDMEAPVIARHTYQEYNDNGVAVGEPKTMYYSMHSMDGLDVGYAMWGGKSESVTGTYYGVTGGIVSNTSDADKSGNKYMGSFVWEDKEYGYDALLTGHNDLFTNSVGTNLAAYITRTDGYKEAGTASGRVFLTQVHQYTLNAKGDICINPNRYSGEVVRKITAEEFLSFAENGQFKIVMLGTVGTGTVTSKYATFNADGTIGGDNFTGKWKIYGDNFIRVDLTSGRQSDTYYGTVLCTWLDDQNCVGMTFTGLGVDTGRTAFGNSVVHLPQVSTSVFD